MTRELDIRTARLEDASAIAGLSAQLGYPATEAETRSRLEHLLTTSVHAVFVAVRDGVLVGWICGEIRISLESGQRVEVTGLVVEAAARRSGIGRQLLAAVEDWAARRHVSTLVVRSNALRTESHPFYEKAGFERAKTQHVYRKRLHGA